MRDFRGRVWKVGDNISTDLLMPSITMSGKMPFSEVKQYCLRTLRPEFAREARPGDIIAAGNNFGCGSSRPATRCLIELGISCVVAESSAAIFFRNSLSFGFPIVISHGVSQLFADGEVAEVRISEGSILNLTTGRSLKAEAYPPFLQKMIEAGGMLELFRRGKTLGEL